MGICSASFVCLICNSFMCGMCVEQLFARVRVCKCFLEMESWKRGGREGKEKKFRAGMKF